MKQVYFLSLLILFPLFLFGQTNTDFWFAAPEVTSGHGDQPIYLRLTSFNQSATVTVSEPANTLTNFPPITVYIPANSTVSVNLTSLINQVECKPPNTILNLGLHIHSNVPITVYYEVANNLNPEIFTLKGNNALGTSFFIPSQSVFYNEPNFNPDAYNSFDIIASEDNTIVTITPRKAIVGHAAGTPFTVTLNQGQVYSAQAVGQQGVDHLMGSTVTSDKPVAITVKDDSDHISGQPCSDLTGDQIVPVNIIGTDYIVVRGFTNTVNDWVFVTATEDNTQITVNGSVAAIINAGYSYSFSMSSINLCSSVQTNKPAYLWHLTGYGCEAGSSLLPAMDCTGSTQVAFTRTTSFSFEMIVLTKVGAQGSFTLDGNSTLVTAAMFSSVPGNPAFVYARINFTSTTLPVGAHILTNSQDIFHMGVIHTYDAGQSGCSYGYFSDFASLNLGSDKIVCPGTSVTFDAGPNRLSYAWFFNGNPYLTGVQTITVTAPGLYSVTVNDHGCILSDEVQLSNYPAPVPVISGVTSFCQGVSQQLSVTGTFNSYLWSTGATTQSISVVSSGAYGVTVTGANACTGSASVTVTVHPLPIVTLAQPASTCSNVPPYLLTGGSPPGGVYSGPGVNSGTGFFNPASGLGPHLITYTITDVYNCVGSDSKTLTVNSTPSVQLAPQPSVCISVAPFQLNGGAPPGGIYSGPGVNSGTGFFTPSSGAGGHLITYTFTDGNGCSGTASKILTVYALPGVQLTAQSAVCISDPPFPLAGGTPPGGVYSGPGVNSLTGYFTPSSGAGAHQITYTYTDGNGCANFAIRTLTVFPLPAVQLALEATVCISDPPFQLTGGTPVGGIYSGSGVNSLTGFFDPASGLGPHLITYTYSDADGCTNAASQTITVIVTPAVQLSVQAAVCISDPPFPLNGGTPTGGIYSGIGVNSLTGFFDPSSGEGLHTITYTFSNAAGCGGSDSKVLTVNPLPIVGLAEQDSVCISAPPFPLSGGTPSGGIYSGAGVNSLTGFFDPSAGAGLYAITYSYSDFNGCINTDSKTLPVNPLPVVQMSGQDGACISASPFLLTCGTPVGGIYSGAGVNSATGFFDPSSGAGQHLITYSFTDANGCANTSSKILTVYTIPVIEMVGQDAACISEPPFLLTCGTPLGGIYSGVGVNSATGFFDPSSGAGAHTITYSYSDANGCSNANSKILTVNLLPVVHIATQPVVCISVPPFLLNGGSPLGGIYSGAGVNSLTGFFDPSAGAGTHTITYTYADANGCSDNDYKTLTVNSLPIVQIAPQPVVCISVTPFPLDGGMPAGGFYSGNGVNTITGFFDPSYGAGQQAITYNYSDFNGCTNTATGILTVNPLPIVQLSVLADVCITDPAFPLGGGIPVGGVWSGAGVNTATGMFNPSSGAGVHLITYAYTDANLCVNSATSNLTVIPLPLPSGTVSGPNIVCEAAQNIQYILSGADPLATSFNWEINPASAGIISGSNVTPSVSVNAGYIGIAGIRFQPVSNCGDGVFSGYTAITVNPNPVVTLQSCNDPVTTRGAKPFQLKGGVPLGGVYSIDGLELPTDILDPSTLSVSPPNHIISYTYTNRYNCVNSKTQALRVNDVSGFICNSTLTDLRDMKTYPTFAILIGNTHRCWISANLNYGAFIESNISQTDNCMVEKYCEGNDSSRCAESGGLYQWDELMTYLPATNASAEGRQGLCPPEWHVATESEWDELLNYHSGAGIAGWALLDPYELYGFHAKTKGVLYQNNIWSFMPSGFSATIFWTSTVSPSDSKRIFSHGLNDINPSVSQYFSLRSNALPVRCVKD
ncbi:MAG: hypothetical protein NT004_07790 [Bacteroidetes bacterium]|nr:hypothetical protein [Bacteroidota bacterium]